MPTVARPARIGDRVVVAGHRVGDAKRIGEIVGVLPAGGRVRVRWEDGHETVIRPGSDAVVEHRRRRRATPT